MQGTARSALDVLLARMQPTLGADELAQQTPHVQWLSTPTWATESGCAWQRPVDDEPVQRKARTPRPRPGGPLAARHSFTTLTQRHAQHSFDPDTSAGDESDVDDTPLAIMDADTERAEVAPIADTTAHPRLLALAAVRGADFGNAVHAIFEHRAVGEPISAQRELIGNSLDEAGVRRREIERADLVDALVERLQAALDAPLGVAGAPALCLADLPAVDLRAEMAFHFPLERASMTRLRAACAQHGEPDLVPTSTQSLSGLMTGKIDLIFHHDGRYHLLDYKGNHLGDTLADYTGARLQEKMQDNHYRFQALLYCVALDRYLRQRLGAAYRRGAHLGECFYLFIRAAGLGMGAGVWRHRFPDALLDEVGAVFDTGIVMQETAR
jgi:exodeoxyribonuclease V beta subunit